jgi:copper chaperone CopZ
METVTYKIPAIHCGHCVHTIKMELADMGGVKSVEVDGGTKLVTIQYESPATTQKIEQLLQEINYPVEKK